MTTSGGNRRLDRILEPGFTDGLVDLPLQEVRDRRDQTMAEREYLSFLRRLVQGRLDILRAEAERRKSGDQEGSVVEHLAEVLSGGGEGGSRGEALRIGVPEEEMLLARRRVEAHVADARISDPRSLEDGELAEAIGRLESEEHEVSESRSAVLQAHDKLQEELKRRYKEDPSEVLTP